MAILTWVWRKMHSRELSARHPLWILTLHGGGPIIWSGRNCLGRIRVELVHSASQKICASMGSDWRLPHGLLSFCTGAGSRKVTLAIHGWSIGMASWVTGCGESIG